MLLCSTDQQMKLVSTHAIQSDKSMLQYAIVSSQDNNACTAHQDNKGTHCAEKNRKYCISNMYHGTHAGTI